MARAGSLNVDAGPSEAHLSPVLVFAAARSGSTFLQRLLNAMERLVIWGEHGGTLVHLARAHAVATSPSVTRNTVRARRWIPALMDKQPVVQTNRRPVNTVEWVGPTSGEEITRLHREFVLGQFTASVPADWRWGFKEIRYGEAEAAYLETLFPRARLIYLVRGPARVLRGQIDALARGENRRLPAHAARLRQFYAGVATASSRVEQRRAVVIRYEDAAMDPHRTASALSAFLGTRYLPDLVDAIAAEQVRSGLKLVAAPTGDGVIQELEQLAAERGVALERSLMQELADTYLAACALTAR